MRVFAFIVDIFFAFDIVCNFYTAYVQDVEVIMSLRKIAMNYMRSYFVFDVLATVPTLVTLERRSLYFLKLFRFFRARRAFQEVTFLVGKLIDKMDLNKQSSERINKFLKLFMVRS